MLERFRRLTRAMLRPCRRPPGCSSESCLRMFDARLSGWFLGESGQLCEGFRISPEDPVIDVGCGDGGMCDFAASCGAEVIATEINAKQTRPLSSVCG